MTQPLVECIPNFSEGRRMEVIDSIAAAISAVAGVRILDRHSDADHNRSVITFAGPPQGVLEAAYAAIARAAELIDLDEHRGEHPRIGATDVVPFVPLSGVTMDDCVRIARQLGERVGRDLGIPVYLYEAAATRPDRVNLERLRRGEYEGLKSAILSDAERAPDFGPSRLGKAGATVIGARAPLIAYNIFLTTDDVEIAKQIAKAIRHSSGGMHYLKALGLQVEGRAQVSMNFTDFTHTPLARVTELIRREAQRHGVSVEHAELVGLVPQAALIDAAQWYLQLDPFRPDQVLEARLYATEGETGGAEPAFLDGLAAGTATPGGGSAAAYAGAMAAALVGMVARLTIGKKKYAAAQERMAAVALEADRLRASQADAVALDARSFEAVLAASKMPKESRDEIAARQTALEQATHRAAEVPLQVAGNAAATLDLAVEAARDGNRNAFSDAVSGASLAQAALRAAAMNVRVNAASVADRSAAKRWLAQLEALEARAAQAASTLDAMIRKQTGSAG